MHEMRDIVTDDFDPILALDDGEVTQTRAMDRAQLRSLLGRYAYGRVAVAESWRWRPFRGREELPTLASPLASVRLGPGVADDARGEASFAAHPCREDARRNRPCAQGSKPNAADASRRRLPAPYDMSPCHAKRGGFDGTITCSRRYCAFRAAVGSLRRPVPTVW